MRSPHEVDVYVACAPCQPYSDLRSHGGSVQDHPGYGVCFAEYGSVLSHVRTLLPSVFLTEQVKGFGRPRKSKAGTGPSPQDAFIAAMLEIKRADGSEHFSSYMTMPMDSGKFVEGSRPRFFGRLCLCSRASNDQIVGDSFESPRP
jgi:hypothetical protein